MLDEHSIAQREKTLSESEPSRVTVVMAVKNGADTIRESVRSLQRQTLTQWTLRIVNDASVDETAEIAKSLCEADSRILLTNLAESVGSGAARNLALKASDTEFFAVLDCDDICLPVRLREQVDLLNSESELACMASQIAEFGTWGGPVVSRWHLDQASIRQRQLAYKMPIPHPSMAGRIEPILKVGGYDEACRRSQDYGLLLRLGPTRRIGSHPDVHVLYRTERPVTKAYAEASAQYGKLAYARAVLGESRISPNELSSKERLTTRLGLIRRNWAERRQQADVDLGLLRFLRDFNDEERL